MMTQDDAIAKLEKQRAIIVQLRGKSTESPEFIKWKRNSEIAIETIFGKEARHPKDFAEVEYSPTYIAMGKYEQAIAEAYARGLDAGGAKLDSMIDELKEYGLPETASPSDALGSAATLSRLCRRFPAVAQQLLHRHGDRKPLTIEDEYDVQDLLHALLILSFDDVRCEEWTPSYAGKSARADFLLKQEQTFIEVKMTRAGHGCSQIGEELIIDTAHYKTHPDCRQLVCLVYDPGHLITNPTSLINDVGGKHDRLDVQVFIEPRLT